MKLKILTLNLWHGGRLMDGVLDFLEQEDADVVCLQEVYNGTTPEMAPRYRSIEILQQRLGYVGCAFAPAFIDRLHEGAVPCGNAILTKLPLRTGKTVFLNEPLTERDPYKPETAASVTVLPRVLQHAVLDTPVGEVDTFNLHGVWDLDDDNFSERRRNMRDAILTAVTGRRNVVLAGDTNAQPTNQLWQPVEQQLHSVFGQELPNTFNMRHKQNLGYATARVDMIFTSPNIKVLQKRCHQVDISDHLPLSATLEIGAARA